MANTPRKQAEGATRPDAWARFERAVDAAVKSGPKHKITLKKKPKKKRAAK